MGETCFQFEEMAKSLPKESENLYIEEMNSVSNQKEDIKLKSMTKYYLGNTSELECTRMP